MQAVFSFLNRLNRQAGGSYWDAGKIISDSEKEKQHSRSSSGLVGQQRLFMKLKDKKENTNNVSGRKGDTE
ncbi:MAG: hypothetical protein DRI57_14455 [Deltaproteobacteria bacterium]|nr:MAG: hypothetical protein DRI57_14455 [Deltaproteobacteria bacterium]